MSRIVTDVKADTVSSTSLANVGGSVVLAPLPTFATRALAIAAGLRPGSIYRLPISGDNTVLAVV